MAEIMVTAAQLQKKADELNRYNTQFKKKVDSLEQTETSLMGMWDGDAKEAFHNAFNRDKINMQNFYNAIAQYVNVLQQIAASYAKGESQNINTANQRSY